MCVCVIWKMKMLVKMANNGWIWQVHCFTVFSNESLATNDLSPNDWKSWTDAIKWRKKKKYKRCIWKWWKINRRFRKYSKEWNIGVWYGLIFIEYTLDCDYINMGPWLKLTSGKKGNSERAREHISLSLSLSSVKYMFVCVCARVW